VWVFANLKESFFFDTTNFFPRDQFPDHNEDVSSYDIQANWAAVLLVKSLYKEMLP
jgi:hypothetical protein